MACCYVYYILNEDDLVYVGRSSTPKKRLNAFKRKTGLNKASLGIPQRFKTLEEACQAELKAIAKHWPPYNKILTSSPGAHGPAQSARLSSRVWSETSKAKVGASSKGRNVGGCGYTHSSETREIMRQKATGRVYSEKARVNMRNARLKFLERTKENGNK